MDTKQVPKEMQYAIQVPTQTLEYSGKEKIPI